MKLTGKTAIVTGASRGIGVHLAEGLARKGVNLALAARSEADLESVAERARAAGVRALAIRCDVTTRPDLEDLVARTEAEIGPVDLLVNNAGFDHVVRFDELDIDDIETMWRTNVWSAHVLTRLVVPAMIRRRAGHVLNMASYSGKIGIAYMTLYSSTKHALVGFTWSLRAELAPHGIGVSAICPVFVNEGGFLRWNPSAKTPALARPVSPAAVVRAAIRAVERNRPEVLVSRPPGKMMDVVYALSPDAGMRLLRTIGLYRFLERKASEHPPPPGAPAS